MTHEDNVYECKNCHCIIKINERGELVSIDGNNMCMKARRMPFVHVAKNELE